MRRLALAALAVCLAAPAAAQHGTSQTPPPSDARCHRLSSVDGDTVVLPLGGATMTGLRLRVEGLDAPEMNGRCPEERALAQEARDEFARLASPCALVTTDFLADRYGRLLARVFTRDGQEIAALLIRRGLARPYDGTGPRGGWCPAGR